MENREKLEIPIIEFTAVTLLNTTDSTCCTGDENVTETIDQTGVGNIRPGQGDCPPVAGV